MGEVGLGYGALYNTGYITLNNLSISESVTKHCTAQGESHEGCPQFNPYKFSADAMLPLVGMGERKQWVFRNPSVNSSNIGAIPIQVFGKTIHTIKSVSVELIEFLYNLEAVVGWLFGISFGIILSQKINRA